MIGCRLRTRFALLVVLVLAAATITIGCADQPRDVTYFYLMVCSSCEESVRMEQLAHRLLRVERNAPHIALDIYDIAHNDGMEALSAVAEDLDISLSAVGLPVLVVDGVLTSGEESVVERIEALESEIGR